jgi:chaperonin GroES
MNLKPIEDVVIIKQQKDEKVGEILIPIDSQDFAEDIGVVRFCGPGKLGDDGRNLPMFVKPGDKVLYSTHGHQVTKINGEELIILRQNSIIGVFHDDESVADLAKRLGHA